MKLKQEILDASKEGLIEKELKTIVRIDTNRFRVLSEEQVRYLDNLGSGNRKQRRQKRKEISNKKMEFIRGLVNET